MRVFLDANVLFSAACNEAGNCRALFLLPTKAAFAIGSSAYAVEEARRNLEAKRPLQMPVFRHLLEGLAVWGEPSQQTVAFATTLGLGSKDAPILAAAMESRCSLLITGDRKDFGGLYGNRHRGVLVLPPADALDLLLR